MTTVNQRQRQVIESVSVTIQAGETVSNSAEMPGGGNQLFGTRAAGLRIPTLAGVTAVTFQASLDLGETYQQLTNPDTDDPVTVVVDGTSKIYWLHIKEFASLRYIKVVIDTAQAGNVTFLIAPLEI